MKSKIIAFLFVVSVFAGGLFAVAAQSAEISGQLVWPEEWVVFATFDRGDPLPAAETLRTVPERMTRPDGTLVEPRMARVARGERLDLNEFFGAKALGNTAWIFLRLHSDAEQTATIGMGADWWFTAWINGEEVLATPDAGSGIWPPTPSDHTALVPLRAGENILAVRVVSGVSSALFAAGGPSEIRAVTEAIGSPADPLRFNRKRPFAGRIPFDHERQAFATAGMEFALPEADADLAAGGLAGLVEMPVRQRYLQLTAGGAPELLDTEEPRYPREPVRLLLSKSRYPAEDRHLDAIVWTTPPDDDGALDGGLEVILRNAEGKELSRHQIPRVSPTGWFFSVGLPPELTGRSGRLEVVWQRDGVAVANAVADFEVRPPLEVVRSGRVPVRLINGPKASVPGMPFTVGVPFPRGALAHPDHVRLVDAAGREIPLQAKVAARWSRFGDVKWLLCDFTADMEGTPREMFFEYGPQIRRGARPPLQASTPGAGPPTLDAGRLRLTAGGVDFDPRGARRGLADPSQIGGARAVLASEALRGGFVRRGDGREFTIPADAAWTWEELGSEKAVLRYTGWFTDPEGGGRFCNYVTRLVFHRDSPVARIFHTWIFTGDGNRDRIADMGWRLETAAPPSGGAFLIDALPGAWLEAGHLVQHDYGHFLIGGNSEPQEGRTPGVMSARVGDSRVLFGAKDFWQNFPSELEITDSALTFFNWPRHNPPAYHERPITPATAFQLRFAHEGEQLSFRLPDEFLEDPIWGRATGNGAEAYWERGRAESANAQGIALTEEMFLYVTDGGVSREESARVMLGLNDETLRAVVDPVWVAASGAFGPIHHRDVENYPFDEQIYELVCGAPDRWHEHLGFYGKWLFGDSPSWGIDLPSRGVDLYRTLRMNHHGWPFKWIPYARGGDPVMLKRAEAATRQMIDVNICHFASAGVDESVGPDRYRRQGHWQTSLVPWTSPTGPYSRGISIDCDYMWQNWYLTGFQRARDVALLWGENAKADWERTSSVGGRASVANLQSYLDMYKATFDPWFLAAAHDLARLHRAEWTPDSPVEPLTTKIVGHFWKPADRDFYWFSGDERHRDVALAIGATWSSPWNFAGGGLWPRMNIPYIQEATAAWDLTGDDFYLGRAAAYLDSANMYVWDGEEPGYSRGGLRGGAAGSFTGWYIQQMPLALAAFERAGRRPESVPTPFTQFQASFEEAVEVNGKRMVRVRTPEVFIRKATDAAVPFLLDTMHPFEVPAYRWQARDASGREVAAGAWDLKPLVAEIPAGAPPGIYRLSVSGLHPDPQWQWPGTGGAPLMPFAGPGVPEVMVFERGEGGTRIPEARGDVQYWFFVPEGTRQFWIESPRWRRLHYSATARLSVWNPEGERVWEATQPGPEVGPDDWVQHRAEITVPPGQDGKLWRVSGSGGLTFDPAIPPVFSTSRPKWFNPLE